MTSSSDPTLHCGGGVTTGSVGVLHDPHRDADLPVSEAQWQLFRTVRAAAAPPRLAAGAAMADVLSLAVVRAMHVSFRPGALVRVLIRSIWRGDDAQLRAFAVLATRRFEIRGTSLAGISGRCLTSVYLRTWRTLALASAICVPLALVLGSSAPDAVAAAAVPWAVVATLAVHEAGHLHALRRLPGHARHGALVVGPWLIAVIRPHLTGAPLRRVAAAGPLVGVGSGIALSVLGCRASWLFIAGIVTTAVHLSNLWPTATDGRQVWGRPAPPPGGPEPPPSRTAAGDAAPESPEGAPPARAPQP